MLKEKENKGINFVVLIVIVIILLIINIVLIVFISNSKIISKTDYENNKISNIDNYPNQIVKYKVDDDSRENNKINYCKNPANSITESTASDTNPCVVVQTYRKGTEWCRVWSDGWKEQGGYIEDTGTINFIKEFSDTNYTITGGLIPGDWRQSFQQMNFYNLEKEKVQFQTFDGYKVRWYACGY